MLISERGVSLLKNESKCIWLESLRPKEERLNHRRTRRLDIYNRRFASNAPQRGPIAPRRSTFDDSIGLQRNSRQQIITFPGNLEEIMIAEAIRFAFITLGFLCWISSDLVILQRNILRRQSASCRRIRSRWSTVTTPHHQIRCFNEELSGFFVNKMCIVHR